MNLYLYDGPVMEFDNCVANRWTASTRAVSEKKARSNLSQIPIGQRRNEKNLFQKNM